MYVSDTNPKLKCFNLPSPVLAASSDIAAF